MKIEDLNQSQIDELIKNVTSRVISRISGSEPQTANVSASASPQSSSSVATCALSNGGECGECAECVEKNPDAVQNIIDAGADRIGSKALASSARNISPFIDHTLLKPNATDEQISKICKEAVEYKFASVCVNSSNVETASRLLSGSGVKVCTVVGFPLGAMSTESKAFETRDAVAKGADEVDMVINVGKLKSGEYNYVLKDIQAVLSAAQNRCVKVILETAMLTDDEKIAACIIAKSAGANYVKTSTGFGGGGATVQDVALMRKTVGSGMGVKASGGIRTSEDARRMIEAGATRIGASASVAIVNG